MSKTHRSLLKAQNFLLEIGCEDLPADDLPIVWPVHLLKERGIACQAVETYATPRRLVLLVRGVEPIVKRAEKGPPVQVAFDPQGKPTRAAEAFAQRPAGRPRKGRGSSPNTRFQ
jgi:glycyl-tRNA synthetase beta chain